MRSIYPCKKCPNEIARVIDIIQYLNVYKNSRRVMKNLKKKKTVVSNQQPVSIMYNLYKN